MSNIVVTPCTGACQTPLSVGFPRQEYWRGLPFSSAGDLLDPGIALPSPALAVRFFTTELTEKPILERWVHGGSGLPWWLSRKGSAFNAGDPGWIPGSGQSPWRRKWQPTPVFLPGKSLRQRSLVGYSPWGCKESDTIYRLNGNIEAQSVVVEGENSVLPLFLSQRFWVTD